MSIINPGGQENLALNTTLQAMYNCSLDSLGKLNEESLKTYEKVANYFRDKTVGIDATDEELSALRQDISAHALEPVSEGGDDARIVALYAQVHPMPQDSRLLDLPTELRLIILDKLNGKQLSMVAATSQSLHEDIKTFPKLESRIISRARFDELLAKAIKISKEIYFMSNNEVKQKILHLQAKSGNIPAALLTQKGCVGDYKNDIVIAQAQVDSGDFQGALEMIRGLYPDLQESVLFAIAKNPVGKTFLSDTALNSIQDCFRQEECRTLAQEGKLEAAQAKADEIVDNFKKSMSKGEIAEIQWLNGEVDEAKKNLQETGWWAPTRMTKIVGKLAGRGSFPEALALTREIVDSRGNPQTVLQDEAYLAILQAQLARDVPGAKNSIIKLITDPKNKQKVFLLAAISKALHGDFRGARDKLVSIHSTEIRDEGFIQLLLILIRKGKFNEAMEMVNELDPIVLPPERKALYLLAMAEEYLKNS